MEQKTYQISGRDFILREGNNLTLDNSEFLDGFFSKAVVTNDQNINLGNFRASDLKGFFKNALIPKDGESIPDNFNWGAIGEDTQLEVMKDFFLSRVGRGINTQNSLLELIGQPERQ